MSTTPTDQGSAVSNSQRPAGTVELPKLDGCEISPGIWIVGEPSPVAGTDRMLALANIAGCLCRIELRISFRGASHAR